MLSWNSVFRNANNEIVSCLHGIGLMMFTGFSTKDKKRQVTFARTNFASFLFGLFCICWTACLSASKSISFLPRLSIFFSENYLSGTILRYNPSFQKFHLLICSKKNICLTCPKICFHPKYFCPIQIFLSSRCICSVDPDFDRWPP